MGIVFGVSVSTGYRARRRARQTKRRLSPAVVVLLIVALVALGLLGVREWRAGRVTLTFVRSDGAVPPLELTIYPDRLTFTAPSPPPPIGQLVLDGENSATLDGDLVPDRAVVRYRGDGVGAGIVFVELGGDPAPIELGAPRAVEGRVGEPIGFWSFGWRSAGLRPIADAEVIAMAGGERGIPVASTTSGEDGRFVLSGIGADVHPLSLRVRAAGYELAHLPVPARDATAPVVAAIQPTKVLRGLVRAPAAVDLTSLCVLARGLPGVQTSPAADGSFELDHLPPEAEPRLLVHGLGDFYGSSEVRADRDGSVRLDVLAAGVVRGRVVDGESGTPIAGALVFPGDATAVRSAADGTFELVQVLPGRVELTAQYEQREKKRRRKKVRFGRTRIEVRGGETLDGVVLTVDRGKE